MMQFSRLTANEKMAGVGRLALVGVAKNCGKTTTLNALLRALPGPLGLVSIGIDGESHDMLIGTAKPQIVVEAGTWVVTTTGALEASGVAVEYVEAFGTMTPMGQLVLARCLTAGHLILAGVRHRKVLSQALQMLEDAGAVHILIDGAYGRTMAAHASVCDGVVLCTGAIVSRKIEHIVETTRTLYDRLGLPIMEDALDVALMKQAMTDNRALLGREDGQALVLPSRSALLGLAQGQHLWDESVVRVAIPGLVSDRVVESLLLVPVGTSSRRLLVTDGANIQTSELLWQRLLRQWQVLVYDRVPVVAMSMNPTSVAGFEVDAGALFSQLKRIYDGWIFDPHQHTP